MVKGLIDPPIIWIKVNAASQVYNSRLLNLFGPFFGLRNRAVFIETFRLLHLLDIFIVNSLVGVLVNQTVPCSVKLTGLGWTHALGSYSKQNHFARFASLHKLAQIDLDFAVIIDLECLLTEVLLVLERIFILIAATICLRNACLNFWFLID